MPALTSTTTQMMARQRGWMWQPAGLILVHVIAIGRGQQVNQCMSSATSDCYDDYSYRGSNGWDCNDWFRRSCSDAGSIADYSNDEISELLAACPIACRMCQSPCHDNNAFSDFDGYSCSIWSSYNCTKAVSKYGYTPIQERVLLRNCPESCYACTEATDESCSFPFKFNGVEQSACVMRDGFRQCMTKGGNWKACTPRGTPCVFPFIYSDVQYYGCSVASIGENHRAAWCATKVDDDGYAVPGHWTTCPGCNVSDLLETAECGLGNVIERHDNGNMGGSQNNNDMGEGNNNDNNDMGNNNDMGDDNMGRRGRRSTATLQRARRVNCGTSSVPRNTPVPKFDQAGDEKPAAMTFIDQLNANPGFMALFVFSILAMVGLVGGLAYRVWESQNIAFPEEYKELTEDFDPEDSCEYGTAPTQFP